jgi:predicted esterase
LSDNPHLSQPVATYGARPPDAALAAILLHGRGQGPGFMIDIAQRLALPHAAWRALTADQCSWYPLGFMAPVQDNQPRLDWALEALEAQVAALQTEGFARERIALIGFSQGACLACEYAWRRPGRWAAVIGFTGGLIGPPGTTWAGGGSLHGTPVLLTGGDTDPWVPWARVTETAEAFAGMGAAVSLRLYPGRGHLVSDAEIGLARGFLRA